MGMTESPQQPGYNAAQQQQQAAAYAAQQQQAYAAQYAAPQPNVFDKLPMNMLTIGLAGGGLLALLLGVLLGALKGSDGGGAIVSYGSTILDVSVGVILVSAVAITTGPKFRNTYRAITTGLAVIAVGSVIGSMIDHGSLESADVVVKLGAGLVLVALLLFSAATYTMAEPDPAAAAAAQQQAAMQAAQQQAAQQQAAAQQQHQQYAATQQHQEQQTTWQQPQQPPQ